MKLLRYIALGLFLLISPLASNGQFVDHPFYEDATNEIAQIPETSFVVDMTTKELTEVELLEYCVGKSRLAIRSRGMTFVGKDGELSVLAIMHPITQSLVKNGTEENLNEKLRENLGFTVRILNPRPKVRRNPFGFIVRIFRKEDPHSPRARARASVRSAKSARNSMDWYMALLTNSASRLSFNLANAIPNMDYSIGKLEDQGLVAPLPDLEYNIAQLDNVGITSNTYVHTDRVSYELQKLKPVELLKLDGLSFIAPYVSVSDITIEANMHFSFSNIVTLTPSIIEGTSLIVSEVSAGTNAPLVGEVVFVTDKISSDTNSLVIDGVASIVSEVSAGTNTSLIGEVVFVTDKISSDTNSLVIEGVASIVSEVSAGTNTSLIGEVVFVTDKMDAEINEWNDYLAFKALAAPDFTNAEGVVMLDSSYGSYIENQTKYAWSDIYSSRFRERMIGEQVYDNYVDPSNVLAWVEGEGTIFEGALNFVPLPQSIMRKKFIAEVRVPTNDTEAQNQAAEIAYFKSIGYDGLLFVYYDYEDPAVLKDLVESYTNEWSIGLAISREEGLHMPYFGDFNRIKQVIEDVAPSCEFVTFSWRGTTEEHWNEHKDYHTFLMTLCSVARNVSPNIAIVDSIFAHKSGEITKADSPIEASGNLIFNAGSLFHNNLRIINKNNIENGIPLVMGGPIYWGWKPDPNGDTHYPKERVRKYCKIVEDRLQGKVPFTVTLMGNGWGDTHGNTDRLTRTDWHNE